MWLAKFLVFFRVQTGVSVAEFAILLENNGC